MSLDQWARITLGGVELPGCVDLVKSRKKLRSELKRVRQFAFVLTAGYTFEIITPSSDDLARWESEGGAL